MRHLRVMISLGVGLLALTLGFPASAHIADQYDSIHFNSGMPDFGTPPRRAILNLRGEVDDRPEHFDKDHGVWGEYRTGMELNQNTNYGTTPSPREIHRAKLLRLAQIYVTAGKWDKARHIYAQIGKTLGWDGDVRDLWEVMRRVEAMQQPLPRPFVAVLRLYLQGIDAAKPTDAQAAFEHVYQDQSAGFLREHALYQQACLAYDFWDFSRAIALYQKLLREFPKTEKLQAALIMIARSAVLPATAQGRQIAVGQNVLTQLRKAFPYGRFHRAVLGLQGRIDFLTGKWPQALHAYFALDDLPSVEIVRKAMPRAAQGSVYVRLLAAYLRRLERTRDYESYERAVFDIDHTRKAFSAQDAAAFSRLLLRQPDIAPPYFYYRLYHTENRPQDFANLAHLADELARLHPEAQLSPLVRVRLAEVYYQRRQYGKALQWAQRAAHPHAFDRALYVRGATLHKLKHYRAAITDFTALLQRFPASPLRHGAREELAILDEAVGDFGNALQQYFALDYTTDIAYLLDIKMTTPQIEALLRRPISRTQVLHISWYNYSSNAPPPTPPRYTEYDLLAYSLGLRYLRDEKWRQAETWLRRVPRKLYAAFSAGRKKADFDTLSPEPLTAVHALGKLQRAIAAARSNNARAAAMYQYATYYSTHGSLLLYNPALWQGDRAYAFSFWWLPKHKTKQDLTLIQTYMYQHEVYARSRALCLEVARRYPHSAVAPRALYRAGCACRRLAKFNWWWDTETKRHDFWKESIDLMQQVVRRYPRSPLVTHARKYARVFAQERHDFRWE